VAVSDRRVRGVELRIESSEVMSMFQSSKIWREFDLAKDAIAGSCSLQRLKRRRSRKVGGPRGGESIPYLKAKWISYNPTDP
jgi:hypothetical protein